MRDEAKQERRCGELCSTAGRLTPRNNAKQERRCGELCSTAGRLTPRNNAKQDKLPHIPQRMCVACRERENKSDLLRLGEGRGAYVHDTPDCIVAAIKKRSFDRALRCKMNILNTLGLCRRAGKLTAGFDAAVEDLPKSAGVLITSDLSEKTKKEITFHCNKHGKKLVEINLTMSDIESVLNKKTGIISISDEGLFKSLTKGSN
jgi:hypothetical protein